jgi:hypothetical protein
MAKDGSSPQPPADGRGPWWVAAAGGGGGIVAAITQNHTLGWALVVAFIAWLVHDILMAWLSGR